MMTLAVHVPWWGLVVLIGVAALVAYWAYARPVVPLSFPQRASLSGLRLVALLLLLLFLLRPVATEPARTRDAVVPVLVDTSRSMRLADVDNQRRIDRAVSLARDEIVPGFSQDFEVETLTFGDGLAPTDLTGLEPVAPRTDLIGALEAVAARYQGRTVAGIVVISDGGDTSGRGAASVVADTLPPVYTVGVGAARPQVDLEVADLTVGEAGVTESVVDLSVSVVSHGRGQRPIEVRVLEDGRLLQVERVVPPGDASPARTVFQVSPNTKGATVYTVEIPAGNDERVVENNRRSVLVQPPGRPRRVLIVEGAPGYEHSFLKRVLIADPGVVADSIVRKGQNDLGEQTFYVQGDPDRTRALASGYPVDRAALFQYDAVIFANIEDGFFRPDQIAMTAQFVAERGGGLLLLGSASLAARGIGGSPLEDVVPVELSDRGQASNYEVLDAEVNQLVLTDDGVAHPIMQLAPTPSETRTRWDAVPRLAGSISLGPPKPGASVLALVGRPGGGVVPLVAVQRYGGGRSMVFGGQAAWRWKMLLPADNRLYESFWGQAVRWLTASAPERISVTTTPGASPGDLVELNVQLRDDEYRPVTDASPVVQVTMPDGDALTISPNLVDGSAGGYAAEFRVDSPGLYSVEATAGTDDVLPGVAHSWMLVGGSDPEFSDPRLNKEVLRRAAAASDGQFVEAADLFNLPALLLAGTQDDAPPTTRDLWHGAWSFVLVVLVLTAEWSLRRTWGMR